MGRAQDATLTNRGTRQRERATRVMACNNTHAEVHPGRWEESSEPVALPLSLQRGTFPQITSRALSVALFQTGHCLPRALPTGQNKTR
jgi:hypothetical protein